VSPSHRAGACVARELYGGEVEERPTGRLTRGPRLAAKEKRRKSYRASWADLGRSACCAVKKKDGPDWLVGRKAGLV
jgi:hypothetical protein